MYRIIRHLSIDVAAGASCMMWLVAHYFQVSVPPVYYFLLLLMVWLIYTTDHLMDARNIQHEAATPRHRFHQKYFTGIVIAELLGIIVFIFFVPSQIPEELFFYAFALSALIGLYFVSLLWARKHRFRYVFKEVFIAFCYTLGVSLLPLYLAWPQFDPRTFLFIFHIFCIALVNLLLFSLIEQEQDVNDEHPSAIKWFGFYPIQMGMKILLTFNLLLGFGSLLFAGDENDASRIILLLMDLSLVLLYIKRQDWVKNEYYRTIGDGIFLYPILLWLYEKI